MTNMIRHSELNKSYTQLSYKLWQQAYKQEPEWTDGFKISYDKFGKECYWLKNDLFNYLLDK
jgi:hypothetical protein